MYKWAYCWVKKNTDLLTLFFSSPLRQHNTFFGPNLRDGHTIATTSRRPLTTTIFGVVVGGCRRSANVCRWSVTGCQRITSTTSSRPPTTTLFSGWFLMVGKWLLMIAEQFWSARGFRCSINNHRQPNKAAIQNEYTFDPEKCRWWRNRGRVVLSWSATGRRLVVGADLHNQLYHPHFKRNSNMYSWNCPRMVVKM